MVCSKRIGPITGSLESTGIFIGERIGQMIIIPYPQIELVEFDTLSDTERGEGGFGSSGN